MNVVVAEKPSVARDLARVLGATSRAQGYFDGNGWRVTWALGHLAGLKTPDEYDPALKRWSLQALPFIPDRFELKPTGDQRAQAQLQTVAALCRDADELVCATDAGREGELIFRYILELAGCTSRAFSRVWLSSLTDTAIRDGLAARRPGSEYDNLHDAARSRSEADWIVGINATRAYTVRYGGGSVLWSVGRVQTPVLALIAQLDDQIRVFEPKPFWELRTRYRGVRFKHTGERSTAEETARALLAMVEGKPLLIGRVDRKSESQPPPLLYDLTQLQRDMNLRHRLSAARTLQVAQELYEKKLLTYPRTDSRHLSADMVGPVHDILRRLRAWDDQALSLLADVMEDGATLPVLRRVFDDSKVSDHHAIVPTGRLDPGLTGAHRQVFDAVATRLVQVFLADRLQDVTTVHATANDVPFRVRGVVVTQPGWTVLQPKTAARPNNAGARDDEDRQELPAFETGESGPHEPELHQGTTKPPRPYTENTLLGVMETSGKLVEDEQLRAAMRGRGLGTPATRAAILETLISRRYIQREKNTLRITDLGRYLVAIIADPLLKSPEMTGEWEFKLAEVERGQRTRAEFMAEIATTISDLVAAGVAPQDVPDGMGRCPRCGAGIVEGRNAYGCSAWRDGCAFVLDKVYRGVALQPAQVRELLARGVLLRPVDVEGPRVLCLTTGGELFDLEPPSRDAQRARPATRGGGAARRSPGKPAATAKRQSGLPACPLCGQPMVVGQKGYGCSGWQKGCRFVVWKEIGGKAITAAIVRTLVEKRRTRLLKGFRGPTGVPASGRLLREGAAIRLELEAQV